MSAPEFIPFSLAEMRDWPEYHALGRALNDLAERAGHDLEMKQVHFERQLVALARSVLACDCCPDCERCDETDWTTPYAPFRLEPDGASGVKATYRCENGHEWPCWFAARGVLEMFP